MNQLQDKLNRKDFITIDEIAFCDSPVWDFGRCPIEKSKGCEKCRYYNEESKL